MESVELLSILDKLIDENPDKEVEKKKSTYDLYQEVKGGIRRDLENLLNTKIDWQLIPEHLTELNRSLVNYGLPDFTSTNLSSKQARMEFVAKIEAIIVKFETRFERVQVELNEQSDEVERELHFTIRALLKGDDNQEIVAYSSRVDSISRTVFLDAK